MRAKSLYLLSFNILFAQSAMANFGVSPGRVELKPFEREVVYEIENLTEVPRALEFEITSWTQEGNKSEEKPSKDFKFRMKKLKLEPKEKKLVKLKTNSKPPKDTEKAYRINFKEVSYDPNQKESGIVVRLNFKAALYRKPLKSLPYQDIKCKFLQKESKFSMSCSNPNGENVLITGLAVNNGEKDETLEIAEVLHARKDKTINLEQFKDLNPKGIKSIEYTYRGEKNNHLISNPIIEQIPNDNTADDQSPKVASA